MTDRCYIITFEIKHDPSDIISAIRSYGTWAKICENVWAIVTTKSAVDVRNHLSLSIQQGERLFIIKSGIEAAWKNVACTNEWLQKNL